MPSPVVHGPRISTYVRTVRMVLAEKGLDYRLVELDILQGEQERPEHLARHPFGKVPVLEHDGFTLYETSAITRYLDAAFPEVPLSPTDPQQIGRMQQAIAVTDAYAYAPIVGTVVIQRLVAPKRGGQADEAAIGAAMPRISRCLAAFDAMLQEGLWLSGGDLGLADLHLAPVMAYFTQTPEGRNLLPGHPQVQRWWAAMSVRDSLESTVPDATG